MKLTPDFYGFMWEIVLDDETSYTGKALNWPTGYYFTWDNEVPEGWEWVEEKVESAIPITY